MNVTDELIAAYADGELTGQAEAEVEAAIAADPALAQKVAAHRALKARLNMRFDPIIDQPLPSNWQAMLQPQAGEKRREAEVVSLAAARQRSGLAPIFRRWAPLAGPALAASLVLALWQPWQSGNPTEGYAGGHLAEALDSQLVASQPANAQTRILLSFESDGGRLCRAWRGENGGGIACRDRSGWKIERKLDLGEAQRTEFRQAASDGELLAMAQEMAAGGALDAAEEEAAKASGWRR